MRYILPTLLVMIVLVACGSSDSEGLGSEGSTTTTIDESSTTEAPTTTAALSDEQAKLDGARMRWNSDRPVSYQLEYTLVCECDQGPWRVREAADGSIEFEHLGGYPADRAPFGSVDEIFDAIQTELDEERFPVRVTYDTEFGHPVEYVFNEPELPVDGGFILRVDSFSANPEKEGDDPDASAQRSELDTARAKWEEASIDSYAYTFTRSCFCPEEYRGPYKVFVEQGEITSASFQGTDLLEIAVLDIGSYDEIALTVDDIFDELDRSIGSADSVMAEYDEELGFANNVYIDVAFTMADEEIGFTIAELRQT